MLFRYTPAQAAELAARADYIIGTVDLDETFTAFDPAIGRIGFNTATPLARKALNGLDYASNHRVVMVTGRPRQEAYEQINHTRINHEMPVMLPIGAEYGAFYSPRESDFAVPVIAIDPTAQLANKAIQKLRDGFTAHAQRQGLTVVVQDTTELKCSVFFNPNQPDHNAANIEPLIQEYIRQQDPSGEMLAQLVFKHGPSYVDVVWQKLSKYQPAKNILAALMQTVPSDARILAIAAGDAGGDKPMFQAATELAGAHPNITALNIGVGQHLKDAQEINFSFAEATQPESVAAFTEFVTTGLLPAFCQSKLQRKHIEPVSRKANLADRAIRRIFHAQRHIVR
ncbi:MAG: hypothetical protein EYC62_02875 [Alphaproteobacteria bacterium]|nr:MAG: hypothetical protein EYC62_02875 [Alphaproteobacteria bacterium]